MKLKQDKNVIDLVIIYIQMLWRRTLAQAELKKKKKKTQAEHMQSTWGTLSRLMGFKEYMGVK